MAIVKDFYLPPPPDPRVLEILSSHIKTSSPRLVQITFRSTTGANYEVQASPSMAPAAWNNLGSFTAGNTSTTITVITTTAGVGQVTDPLLDSAARRFYRVIRR